MVAALKELKGDNDVVSKLQNFIAEMNRRFASEFQTLATAMHEYKWEVKKMDFQLKASSRWVGKTMNAETLRMPLKGKVGRYSHYVTCS